MLTLTNFWLFILTVGSLESSVTPETIKKNEMKLFEERSPRRGGLFHTCGSNQYAEEASSSCMPRSKCVSQGGNVKGFCNFYEVCCETKVDCNSITKEKRVVIKSASLQKTPNFCSYRMQPFSTQVCQVLIEFKTLELQPPILEAMQSSLECEDHVVIGDFMLCGGNSGQHLYVPFDGSGSKDDTELLIKFALPNKWSQSQWHLIVTQLECPKTIEDKKRSPSYMPFINSNNLENLRTMFTIPYNSNNKNTLGDIELLAPLGCNQYFTQSEGQVKSFNYKPDGSGYYLSKMNYVICIKPVKASNMIRYQVEKFSLSKRNTEEPGFDNNCHSYKQVDRDDRREDYLMIPQSSLTTNGSIIMATHYCGQSLVKGSSVIVSTCTLIQIVQHLPAVPPSLPSPPLMPRLAITIITAKSHLKL
uniref:CUB domain-containing protein n=1 Tax=Glossina pallidipes TaxID=7398 RepID=A0A1A9ZL15_GLOPL